MTQPGKRILVQAYKADGHVYRFWTATVEAADAAGITTVNPVGHLVFGEKDSLFSQYAFRAYYWFGKPYNLLEVYLADGALKEIYIHICSPPELQQAGLHYTDYELDVVRYPGEVPFINDEDEFQEAAGRYGYSAQFQHACYEAVNEAIELAKTWTARGYESLTKIF